MNKRKEKKSKPMFYVFLRMYKEMFATIPIEGSLYCFCDILHALSTVLVTVFMQKFFDSAADVAEGGKIETALVPLLIFFVSTLAMEIFNGLANFHYEYLSPKVISHLYEDLHKKAASVNPIEYEKTEFLDMLNKARQGIESGFTAALFALSVVTFYLPYYLFLGIYLRTLSPLLVFILLLIFVPVILGKLFRFRAYVRLEDEVAPTRRAMEYYEKAICDREYFKDTRLLGAFPYFMRKYHETIELVNDKTTRTELKNAKVEFCLRVFTVAGYLGILGILVYELLHGKISAGAFAAVFAGIGTMYNLAEEVFGGVMQYISHYGAAILNYQKFVDREEPQYERQENVLPADEKGISFHDVHFRYPGAGQEVIRGISLHIEEGKTVALVGENGAGKSTFAKLVVGLYEPTSGKVIIHGRDASKSDRKGVYRLCSAVFQKFQRYQMTLEKNILISDIEEEKDSERFQEVCKSTRADIVKADEMLSKEFGGTDISGGEWQRVATARGLYRRNEIIVLDEPTSAIDPIEETKIYRQFMEIAKDKTAILVTHRIGAAQIADEIIVLKDGKIDDVGTHQQLLEHGGLYAKLYREQAKWYR